MTPKPNPSPPRCWCGVPMRPIGRGRYPYDCKARDLFPDHMVYVSGECGHSGWLHQDEPVREEK